MRRILLVCVGLFAVSLLGGCGYSSLREKEVSASKAWSELGFSCRQRLELTAAYVDTVKRHIAEHSQLLDNIQLAMQNAVREGCPRTPPETSQKLQKFKEVQAELTRQLASLQVLLSTHPQLMDDSRYLAIHKRLEVAENHVNEAIMAYNSAIHDFNMSKRTFPNVLINALILRYGDKEPFRPNETARLVAGRS